MKKQKVLAYGIGIDISKDKFHVCIKSRMGDGRLVIKSTKNFGNTPSGHKSFFEWLEKYRKEKDLPYQIVLEVTGVYHEHLLYFLYKKGLNVCLEMPKRVKRYLESIGQKSKTDKLDSQGIAQMAIERKLKNWQPASKEILELRALLRHRKSLIKSKNQCTNQLHALDHSVLEAKIVKRSLKGMVKKLDREIEVMDKKALELSKKDESFYKKAKMISDSITGLGMLSMLTVLSETNGFNEMRSQKQLESYAGFDVIEKSSGNHSGKTKISKRGNVHLRTAMYMPVLTVLQKKPKVFYDLYLRIVKRNGGLKKKAMVAVQRKLLVMVYTLWKKNEAFDPGYEEKRQASEGKKIVLA